MDDLTAFLRARLDDTNTGLHTVECGWHQREFGHEGIDCTCGAPDRLLAEVDAKRRIIDMYAEARQNAADCREDYTLAGDRPWSTKAEHLAPVVRLLALPHAAHPDYREEWRT